jgi:predicted nucleic acid-binding protein
LPKKKRHTAGDQSADSAFVDSSAFIALLSSRDQYHAQAEQLFRKAAASKKLLLTSNLILSEVHRLVLHRAGISAAAAALNRIESSRLIRIEFATSAHHNSAKEWLARLSGYSISYADAISFAVMNSTHCTEAITFDRHFQTAGFTSIALY